MVRILHDIFLCIVARKRTMVYMLVVFKYKDGIDCTYDLKKLIHIFEVLNKGIFYWGTAVYFKEFISVYKSFVILIVLP